MLCFRRRQVGYRQLSLPFPTFLFHIDKNSLVLGIMQHEIEIVNVDFRFEYLDRCRRDGFGDRRFQNQLEGESGFACHGKVEESDL